MVLEFLTQPWRSIVVVAVIFVVYFVIKAFLKKALIKQVRTKKMKHNITIFTNVLTYVFVLIVAVMIVIYFSGDKISLGITAGLLTAALGWALQRPITGIAAWIMVVVAKPFSIGDRIIVGATQGDVANITLSHIYLKEFGGTTGGEETSGRIIMIPNSVLFEKDVVNYTLQDDYILDEVVVAVTFSSDMDLAKKICLDVAKKVTKDFSDKVPGEPYLRLNFQQSGMDLRVRFYAPADKRQLYHSDISEEILKRISAERKVEIAYPHSEILYRKK
ncbi:hypothetical protein CMI37_33015 [Candidatus Pacearchaeota archaeon]|nr:hypothetical protein [Candidatus Pacearchaeota archaeon]|tara:strand:+ start:2667 stop:3491 length:825 start_codon:yes stop_codon:yes gene_type:complete